MDNHIAIGQAARYLGVDLSTLRRWDNTGVLRSVRDKHGRRWYAPEDLKKKREQLERLDQIKEELYGVK